MIHFNETWVLIPNIRRFQPQYQSSWNFFFCSWWFLYLPWRIVRCQYYYCREGMKSEKHRAHRPIWRTFYVADQSSQFKPVEPRLIYYIKCRAEWWAERLRTRLELMYQYLMLPQEKKAYVPFWCVMQQLVPEKATKVNGCQDRESNSWSYISGAAALPQSYGPTTLVRTRH